MRQRSRVAHFAIDVDDLDKGVALWPAALDAKEEQLSEASSEVYRKLRRRPAGGADAPSSALWRVARHQVGRVLTGIALQRPRPPRGRVRRRRTGV